MTQHYLCGELASRLALLERAAAGQVAPFESGDHVIPRRRVEWVDAGAEAVIPTSRRSDVQPAADLLRSCARPAARRVVALGTPLAAVLVRLKRGATGHS